MTKLVALGICISARTSTVTWQTYVLAFCDTAIHGNASMLESLKVFLCGLWPTLFHAWTLSLVAQEVGYDILLAQLAL